MRLRHACPLGQALTEARDAEARLSALRESGLSAALAGVLAKHPKLMAELAATDKQAAQRMAALVRKQ